MSRSSSLQHQSIYRGSWRHMSPILCSAAQQHYTRWGSRLPIFLPKPGVSNALAPGLLPKLGNIICPVKAGLGPPCVSDKHFLTYWLHCLAQHILSSNLPFPFILSLLFLGWGFLVLCCHFYQLVEVKQGGSPQNYYFLFSASLKLPASMMLATKRLKLALSNNRLQTMDI